MFTVHLRAVFKVPYTGEYVLITQAIVALNFSKEVPVVPGKENVFLLWGRGRTLTHGFAADELG